MPLSLRVEDIYFITGLSRRGEIVKFRALGVGGGLTIDEYIAVHCLPYTEKVGSQVPMNYIQNLGLHVIVLVLAKIAKLASLHQDSRPLMFYVVE